MTVHILTEGRSTPLCGEDPDDGDSCVTWERRADANCDDCCATAAGIPITVVVDEPPFEVQP